MKDLSCIFFAVKQYHSEIPISYYEIHQWLLLKNMINKVHQIKGLMLSIIVTNYLFFLALR